MKLRAPPARSPRAEVIVPVATVAHALDLQHYLGAARRGFAWSDEYGIIVLSNPSSRSLPHDRWLELTRWCLSGEANAGSRQWAAVSAWLMEERPDVTTVVSYSDPGVGHTGALYRACNWLWAPTWHRLRPPPSGNGSWSQGGKIETVKDRWIYPLQPDPGREAILGLKDAACERRWPAAQYREPRVRRGRVVRGTGGGDYRGWVTARG